MAMAGSTGLEKQNPEKCVLLPLKILYGLKQAAYAVLDVVG
jgi:hypothetical protein